MVTSWQIRVLSFLLLLSAAVPAPAQEADSLILARINPRLPDYTLRFMERQGERKDETFSYRLQISRAGQDSVLQVIDMDLYEPVGRPPELVDINFDGYRDLRFLSGTSLHGEAALFDYWLFDTEAGRFDLSESFSGYSGFYVDREKQRLSSFEVTGCASQCFEARTFRVVGDQLLLLEREEQFYDIESDELRRIIERVGEDGTVSTEEVDPIGL